MTSIGILSDTHSLLIPQKLLNDFKKVDLIIHAGDICDEGTLDILRAIAPVRAVQGNMDEPLLKKRLPLRDSLAVEGISIGVYHGHGATRDALHNALKQFEGQDMDIIIFGHSHQPVKQVTGKTLMFNPGSPNDVVRAPYFSYGILEVNDGKFKANIVKI